MGPLRNETAKSRQAACRWGLKPGLRVLVLCLVATAGPVAFGQVSPGRLSKAHHDLEGTFQCAKCHMFGSSSPELKCLDCHQEIARRLTEKRGYHAAQAKPGLGSNDCGRCHSEHNGLDYRIVRWPGSKEKFDHAQAGWKLQGKHAELKCAECHTQKYIDAQDLGVLKRHDLNSTFTGLETACIGCHRDVHAGQLSQQCSDCHSQSAWKNPPGFSHERTRYQLTGLHAKLDCGKCHLPAAAVAGSPIRYKIAMAEQCVTCHADPHGNAFGWECARCHTTGGWKQVRPGNDFDHNRTEYPLVGKHAAAACRDCHRTENFKAPVAFARCLDCHKAEHGEQFAHREDGGDCKACHTETGWKPAHFDVSDHGKTGYPLAGKHVEVACAKCHEPKGKETEYRVAFAACTNCHKDEHEGQFAAKPHENRCDDCHGTAGWKPASYAVSSHNQSTFSLKGAHLAVPCSGCHEAKGNATPYHPAAAACNDCHQNVHGAMAASARCDTCHSVASWKERGRFDHTQTAFALLGRHAAVDCLACHKTVVENGSRTIPFRGAAKDCAGCHADVHAGQFEAAGDEKGCARCHTVLSWRPTEFDHSRHSTFNLDGAHERVPCRLCHNQVRESEGRAVIVYKGTPRECKQCHQ
jgi:hypothetical protein